MNIRRMQGWALIISGAIDLVGLIGAGNPAIRILFLIGALLLIFGIPAIQSIQPMGAVGLVGIVLIEIAALIALVANLNSAFGGADFNGGLPLASAIAGMIGQLVVGWLTTRRDVFLKWVGWAFMVGGVLNLLGGLITDVSLASVIGVIVPLVGAGALLGYGWGITQHAG